MKIHEIKYPRKFEFYIGSNSKTSRFAKLSTCIRGSNLQFAKLSPRKIKVFYSSSLWGQGAGAISPTQRTRIEELGTSTREE